MPDGGGIVAMWAMACSTIRSPGSTAQTVYFGLLWRVLGPSLVGERQARLIDENFIQPLDLNDNTGEQNSLCDAIGF